MQAKALELRDEGTFIPILAVDMNPATVPSESGSERRDAIVAAMGAREAQRYLLRRCGYPCDGEPNILLARLEGRGKATNDPYGWTDGTRTMPVAHQWIITHWAEIKDGDVIDVQFILGETSERKRSERELAG